MKKSIGVACILWTITILLTAGAAYGQSGIYDRTGIIPGHGSQGSFSEENIDLFTGNLILRYRDVFLPGPNGFNLEVWRTYNSKILADRQSGNPVIKAYDSSWVGIGWTMHMGILHAYVSDRPIIEYPDGRLETAYPDEYGIGTHITRDFIKYDSAEHKLYFQNGVIWTFGTERPLVRTNGTYELVLMVTRIENSVGHHMDIEYNPVSPTISRIIDSMGRIVTFVSTVTTPRKLLYISFKDSNNNDRIFNYSG